MLKFTLPFPPSVNGLFGGGSKQKRFPSKKYKAWLKECPELKAHRVKHQIFVHYRFFWPDKRVRDGQNFMKAPLDYLVNQEVLADDNWNIVVGEEWNSGGIDRNNPRVEIFIQDIKR